MKKPEKTSDVMKKFKKPAQNLNIGNLLFTDLEKEWIRMENRFKNFRYERIDPVLESVEPQHPYCYMFNFWCTHFVKPYSHYKGVKLTLRKISLKNFFILRNNEAFRLHSHCQVLTVINLKTLKTSS